MVPGDALTSEAARATDLERRAGFVLLFVYVVAAPLLPSAAGNPWSAHAAFAAALVGVAAVGLLVRGGRVALAVPDVAMAVALCGLAVSTWRLVSLHAVDVLQVGWTATQGLAHGAVFIAARALIAERREGARAAASILGLSLAAVLVVAVVDEGRTLVGTWSAWRPEGPYDNPNVLGAVAGGLALLVANVTRRPVPRVVAVALMLTLLVLTRSRGALVATAAVAWLAAPAGVPRRRTTLVVVAVAIVVALVPNPLRERWTTPDHATFSRLDYWRFALSFVPDAPFGVGAGMYADVVPAVANDVARPWLVHQRHGVGITHNGLLTVWVEWGWLAGAALVALVPWCVRRLAARDERAPTGGDPLRRGATSFAAVLFIELQVDGVEQSAAAFTLFLVALAVALGRAPGRERAWLRMPARVVGVVALGVVVVLVSVGVQRSEVFAALQHAREVVARQRAGAASVAAVDAAFARATGEHGATVRAPLEHGRFWVARAERLPDGPARDAAVARARDALTTAAARDPLACGPGSATDLLWRLDAPPPDDVVGPWPALLAHLARDPLDVEARAAGLPRVDEDGRPRVPIVDDVFERLEPNHTELWLEQARRAERLGRPSVALHAYVRAAEAIGNARRLLTIPSWRSRAFYERQAAAAALSEVLAAAARLRRGLYF